MYVMGELESALVRLHRAHCHRLARRCAVQQLLETTVLYVPMKSHAEDYLQ